MVVNLSEHPLRYGKLEVKPSFIAVIIQLWQLG